MTIKQAIEAFELGKLVAMPTETVYGLAAPINKTDLLKKVFQVKQRPLFDPLIVHVCSMNMAKKYSSLWCETTCALAKKFWPGPLTIVVPKADDVDPMITAGLDTVGLRWPKHKLACELIETLGVPVAAPSANTFTKTSPTHVEHVKKYFDPSDVYILEGECGEVGIESTIVRVCNGQVEILRPGMISRDELETVVDRDKIVAGTEHLKSVPGSHHTHYRPEYDLVVTTLKNKHKEIESKLSGVGQWEVFHESPQLIARKLYRLMHEPLNSGCSYKVFDLSSAFEVYSSDQWQGIFNRLEKACCLFIKE